MPAHWQISLSSNDDQAKLNASCVAVRKLRTLKLGDFTLRQQYPAEDISFRSLKIWPFAKKNLQKKIVRESKLVPVSTFEHTCPLQGLNTIACQQLRALGGQPAGGQWVFVGGGRRVLYTNVLYTDEHKEVI